MATANGDDVWPLPASVSEDFIDCTSSCGLNFHVLTAGKRGAPLILFCHGYPELSFSWRKSLPAIASAGYYCVAMDQRGYGRTTGWEAKGFHEVDLSEYTMTNLVRDLVCLVYGLGYDSVACIVGHDFGAVSSAMAALMRPDVFRATVQMSHPHHAPPTPTAAAAAAAKGDIDAALTQLDPPRKHYKWYNSTPAAAHDWDHPAQGLAAFLRGYFHLKSADWVANAPHPLRAWTAPDLAVMPEYYIMAKDDTMSQSVAKHMRGEDAARTEPWLPPADLDVYCREWARVGFQAALNWYRAQTASTPQSRKDLLLYAGRKIEVPCAFISGKQDWGNFQQPGAFESYEDPNCVRPGCFRGVTMIDHAGHWVQQEQPEAVNKAILDFLKTL